MRCSKAVKMGANHDLFHGSYKLTSSQVEVWIPSIGMIGHFEPASCRRKTCGGRSKSSLLGGYTVAKKKAAKKKVAKKVAKKTAKKKK
jgi:hypothetical protein